MKYESNDHIKECLMFTKNKVQWIQEETYKLLKQDKYINDKELHTVIYKIHQKAHDVTKVIDTYF
jgi:hypothetical protein